MEREMPLEKRVEILEGSIKSLASIYGHLADWLIELENITRKYNRRIAKEWYGDILKEYEDVNDEEE